MTWDDSPVDPMATVGPHYTAPIALSMLLYHCTDVSVTNTRTN